MSVFLCPYCIASASQDKMIWDGLGMQTVWLYKLLPSPYLLLLCLWLPYLELNTACLFIMEMIFVHPAAENLKWCIKSIGFWTPHYVYQTNFFPSELYKIFGHSYWQKAAMTHSSKNCVLQDTFQNIWIHNQVLQQKKSKNT